MTTPITTSCSPARTRTDMTLVLPEVEISSCSTSTLDQDECSPNKNVTVQTNSCSSNKKATIQTIPCSPNKKVTIQTSPCSPNKKVTIQTSPCSPCKKVTVQTSPCSPNKKVTLQTSPCSPCKKVTVQTTPCSPNKKATIQTSPCSPNKKVTIQTTPCSPKREMSGAKKCSSTSQIRSPLGNKGAPKKEITRKICSPVERHDSNSPAGRHLSPTKGKTRFVWLTRETAKPLDQQTYLRVSLREAIIYLIFFLCLVFLTIATFSPWITWHTKLLKDLFIQTPFPLQENNVDTKSMKTYPDIVTHNDFWQYLVTVLPKNLWYDLYPDDILVRDESPSSGGVNDALRNVLYENRLIRLPRIRQLKVKNGSCDIHSDTQDLTQNCYAEFSESYEDKDTFGPGWAPAWTYSDDNSVYDSDYYTGQVGIYPPTGFNLDLSASRNNFLDQLSDLKNKSWITQGTRAVFIDVSMYNANVNLFGFVKLIFEFPPVGGIIPSWDIVSLQLLNIWSTWDYLLLLLKLILLGFLIYYTIEEYIELYSLGFRRYITSFWNWVDMILIALGWLYCVWSVKSNTEISSLLQNKTSFAKFDQIISKETSLNMLMVVIVFVAFFKLLKYGNISQSMNIVYRTVLSALGNLLLVLLMLLLALNLLAVCALRLFGNPVFSFNSHSRSFVSLLRCVWGDFTQLPYDTDISFSSRIFYFLVFGIIAIFWAVILTVILNAYRNTQLYPTKTSYDNYVLYLRNRWSLVDALLRSERWTTIQENLSENHSKNTQEMSSKTNEESCPLFFHSFIHLLKCRHFTTNEIDRIIDKFHLRPDTQLDASTLDNLISEIEKEAETEKENEKKSLNRIEEVDNKVGQLMNNIDLKIDNIIARVSNLQDRLSRLERDFLTNPPC